MDPGHARLGLLRRGALKSSLELSAAHLGELVRELSPLCVGREVREVRGLVPHDLVLYLAEDAERVRRLRLSADPHGARVHLQIGRLPGSDPAHGPFFRAAAERIRGTRLAALEQVAGDRILRLSFAGRDERSALVAELAGRHANLVLLDGDGRILAVLRPAPARAAQPEETKPAAPRLAPGASWRPPPGGDPRRARGAPLAEHLPAPPEPGAAEGGALARLAPLSWRVECALGPAADRRWLEARRRDLVQRLARRLESAQRLLAGLRRKSAAGQEAERLRMDGELLKANLHRLRRGLDALEVQDYFAPDTPPRRIELDPRLDGLENAQRLFARYRKHVRALAKLPAELGRAEEAVQLGERFLARAQAPELDPEALEREAVEARWLRPRQVVRGDAAGKAPGPRLPYRRFLGARGSEIRVGRSAADNDRLTFREARGNDLWLHTAEAPGSHVVLRLEHREPDEEELLDAAHLAVHYSPLRGARRAAVHVARCKEVKKPRRAPPGLVTLSGGRTLELRVEPARLERLLRGARAAAGGDEAGEADQAP